MNQSILHHTVHNPRQPPPKTKMSKTTEPTAAQPATPTILTEETVPGYLTDHASEIGIFPPNAKITAKSILGGNVNYAFRAVEENEESDSKAIFLKQAPEFVAIFGPGGLPLTSERMVQEIAVYNEWRNILGEETKYLPKIYHFDSELHIAYIIELLVVMFFGLFFI